MNSRASRLRFILPLLASTIVSPPSLLADAGTGSAQQSTAEALAAIKAIDKDYHAVISIAPNATAEARSLDLQRRARGVLYPHPILLKDNIETRDQATTAGSIALANNYSGVDAPLVSQLRQADGVILGKANLSEWANFRSEHSSSGWSAVGGQTRNAHDRTRSPCGSSAGSAVAVALGYVDITIGTETSGSIVCPAAVNGVVGFKPTQGLVSGEGIVPLASSQDTAGPITKNVELAAKTLSVITVPDPAHNELRAGLMNLSEAKSLNGTRIGVFANSLGFEPRRDKALAAVLASLEAKGAVLVPGLRIKRYADYRKESYDVLLYEFRRDLNAYLDSRKNLSDKSRLPAQNLEEIIAFNTQHASIELPVFDQSIFLRARDLADSEAEYLAKRERIRRANREEGLDRLFAEHKLDALIGVTTSVAWMIDPINGDAFFGPSMAGYAAVAGNPHVTLPLGAVGGMPLGISLIGERWQDHRLAQIAWRVEQAHPKPNYVSANAMPSSDSASRNGDSTSP